VAARLADCGAKVRKLHFGDLLLVCFVDEYIAGFDVYAIVRFFSNLLDLAQPFQLTCMYVAISVERL
jgi:hypothetical protein